MRFVCFVFGLPADKQRKVSVWKIATSDKVWPLIQAKCSFAYGTATKETSKSAGQWSRQVNMSVYERLRQATANILLILSILASVTPKQLWYDFLRVRWVTKNEQNDCAIKGAPIFSSTKAFFFGAFGVQQNHFRGCPVKSLFLKRQHFCLTK